MSGLDSALSPVSETAPKRSGSLFTPGGAPGPGRPKGPNGATKEVRAAARLLVDDPEYRELLKLRLRAGEAPHMETLLWHYAYGKPKDVVEVIQNADGLTDLTDDELAAHARLVALRVSAEAAKEEAVQ